MGGSDSTEAAESRTGEQMQDDEMGQMRAKAYRSMAAERVYGVRPGKKKATPDEEVYPVRGGRGVLPGGGGGGVTGEWPMG